MKPLHIALVHTDLRVYWPPRLRALSRSLRQRGNRFSVIEIAGRGSPYDFADSHDTGPEADWWILFPDGDLRTLAPRTMARAVEDKLAALRPDVVMAGGIAFPSGAAAVRWARRNHRGVVILDNVRQEDVPRSKVVEFVKRRIYANVDAVLIPAASHTASYQHWGIPPSRVFLGLNAVDNEWFGAQANRLRAGAAAFRKERNLPKRFFLGVGRQVEKKNWWMCLSAYARYRASAAQAPWGLVLVGNGPEHQSLKDTVRIHGIRDVVLPGVIQGEELIGYYVAANAFLLPSRYGETWGCVVNEAMACGLPVLVSNRCGCAETLVRRGVNGWVFSPDDPAELAGQMLRISALPRAALTRMGVASREIVRPWGLDRFVAGAQGAIDTGRSCTTGFRSGLDRILIGCWNGRFRPI